jgi:glutamate carboxypeptidase
VLVETFADLGGELREIELPPSTEVDANGGTYQVEHAPAIRVRRHRGAPVRVALTGHYDTVFPVESSFRDVTELGPDLLRGPGVADMKGGLAVMHEALRAFEQSPFASRLDWEVLLSPDEELGSPGSRHALADLGAWAHVGLTYEPALPDGSLAGARKGSAKLSLVVRGRHAHAGREHHLGRNAIAAAARFAAAVDALNGERGGVTFNVARIDGGGQLNVVPDLGICRFEVRVRSEADWQWAEAAVARAITAACSGDGLRAELVGGMVRPPKPLEPANRKLFELTRTVGQALGLELKWRDTGGVCEGNNLWGAGCPSVDTLGVRGGSIHSENEFIILPSLVERSQLSALLLMKLASGADPPPDERGTSP